MGIDDPWVVVSGAGGALGSALAAYYGSRGEHVLALDRQFELVSTLPANLTQRTVDLLLEHDVRNIISDTLTDSDKISLLINAVGQIRNEPLLAYRGGKLVTHSLETWRRS